MTIEEIVGRETVLREAAIKLNDQISNPKVKEALGINRAFDLLGDILTLLIPSAKGATSPRGEQGFLNLAVLNLGQAEQRLKYAEKMLADLGPNLETSN